MFRKNKYFQDLDYLIEQDLNDTRPNFQKLERIGVKEKSLAFSLFAIQKDIPKEVQDFYLTKAKATLEQENKKYSHLLKTMETKNYNSENNLGNNSENINLGKNT